MGVVVSLNKRQKVKPEIVKLKMLSDRLDNLLIDAFEDADLKPQEILGILAHRLGVFIKAENPDRCEKLHNALVRIIREESGLSEVQDKI